MAASHCFEDQLSVNHGLERVLIVEAAAGANRRHWLENHLQELAKSRERTFYLDCDFDLGGPWAGVNEFFSDLLPEIQAQRPDLVEQHVFELVQVLPQLRRQLSVRNPSLTDLAPPSERSRNYAADRAFRIVHGLIDLLDNWKSATSNQSQWVIACDSYDFSGPMTSYFFKELMRRRGERLGFHLLLCVARGQGEKVRTLFLSSQPIAVRPLRLLDEPPVPLDRAVAAQMASDLEERIGEDLLERQAKLPQLIRLWRLAARPEKVLHYKYLALEICNPLGLYEEGLRYSEGILSLAAEHQPENEHLRWSIIMKMLACYSGLQDAKGGLHLAEQEGLKAVEGHPSWRGQVFYMIAMLYARYSQPRDFAKGEEYLDRGLEAIEESDLPDGERHLHSVFNRNGLAMIRSFQGRHQEALDLCKSGIVRLNTHLSADKHRLHRSVLVYNIAQVYSATGSYSEALDQYAVVMAMDPNYSEYYNERGNLLLRLGRLQEARGDYLKAIELSPPYFEVFTNLGQCHRRMGAMAEAIEAYSRALDLQPRQLLALVGRAKAHEESGHVEAAISDYTEALSLDSNQWEVLASRGATYYFVGDLLLSLEDFNRAVDLKPDRAELYQNRATVLTNLAQYHEAAQDLRLALSLNPPDEDRLEIQARLKKITLTLQSPISG
ncbi:MAG: tetratricopeptide repeat protein [Acidobacteriia bacterium]|nr:tetratricopeptide repeat protein [Terriglobia bacterium]